MIDLLRRWRYGLLAIALRRRSDDAAEPASLNGDGDSEILGEYVTAPETVPAT